MDIELVKLVTPILIGVITTGIPSIISLIKKHKKYKSATTEAEKAKAQVEVKAEIKRLIAVAEDLYKGVNGFLKTQGSSAGGMKLSYVLTAIKCFCLERGYECDEATLTADIEAEVAFTKNVNAR